MNTRCPQCGYKVDLLTETQFYTCGQCGAAFRVYGGQGVPEQYLRHDRDDALAWGALLGLLEAEGCQTPAQTGDIRFGYHPFWFADLSDGKTCLKLATTLPDGFPLPSSAPVGALEFNKPPLSFPQPSLQPETALSGAGEVKKLRLLQLPLYLISYQIAGSSYQATVSGCTWQVHSDRLPEEAGLHLPPQRLTFLGAYLATLLAAGMLAPNMGWRSAALAVILLSAWGLERSGFGRG
jgi:DNA-directed RNA polymerase subunit RPC12/RpoP